MPLASNAEKLAKNAENFPEIFGNINLTGIREQVAEILKLIGRDGIFREYTLHDANHIDAMLALVDKIIPAETVKKMRTADWLLIVLSCYFHDLGMLVTKKEFADRERCPDFKSFKVKHLSNEKTNDYIQAIEGLPAAEKDEFLYQEFVRENHAKRIYHWIQGQDAPQYGSAKPVVEAINSLLSGLEKIVRDDLAKICLSHHEDDLDDLEKYQLNRVYGDNACGEANLHYAAIILRTVDVLQIQKKRVPTVLYKLIDPSNPKSQDEWAKQSGVRAVKPKDASDGSPGSIEIHALFDKESAYFGLLAYIQQYAARELARCYDWCILANSKGSTLKFPWKTIDTTQVEPSGFEGRTYAFKLDQEKILKLLTGHTLYNDYRVAIREVLQNALDAVRFRHHLNPSEPMGKIDVIWDSVKRNLVVRDTGTGMTQKTIENFLLNVGSSYYQSDQVIRKHSDFSSISRFGIGVLSTFMIADEVQILTVHPDEEYARKLTLPSVVKSYLVKKIPKGEISVQSIGLHGTEVVLHIRRSAQLDNVEALLRYWMVLPECEVTFSTPETAPVRIGFDSSEAVVKYYYEKEGRSSFFKEEVGFRTEVNPGLDLAYIIKKSVYSPVWDFAINLDRRYRLTGKSGELAEFNLPPGMCVEGIRVRSIPAGYMRRENAPWVFANFTGREAPKTNVARSDIENNDELDKGLFKIYSLLGKHIQNEFTQLTLKNTGYTEAAREVNSIKTWGLEQAPRSSFSKYDEAMADLSIIAMEEKQACRPVSINELSKLGEVWTVDSPLARNLEGISGILGIHWTAETIVSKLGKIINPTIPSPRILGSNSDPISKWSISKILIHSEERSQRIDVCWKKEGGAKWIQLSQELFKSNDIRSEYSNILLTEDTSVYNGGDKYDMIVWRGTCLILGTSPLLALFKIMGPTTHFARVFSILLQYGQIPVDEIPRVKEYIKSENGINPDEFISKLKLPFEYRFGQKDRDARSTANSWGSW